MQQTHNLFGYEKYNLTQQNLGTKIDTITTVKNGSRTPLQIREIESEVGNFETEHLQYYQKNVFDFYTNYDSITIHKSFDIMTLEIIIGILAFQPSGMLQKKLFQKSIVAG